jgi:4a-hydroxytetrahydrobiopterin dehydratase
MTNVVDLSFQQGHITETLEPTALDEFLKQLPEWQVSGITTASLVREFDVGDFVSAMALATEITGLAEKYNHHPELNVTYGKLRVSWWTHTADGITQNDVLLAALSDQCHTSNESKTN